MTHPLESPLIPQYGSGTLADVLPSIAYRLGDGDRDRLGVGPGQRWVVLLIDGLGAEQLSSVTSRAPFLAGELRRGQVITCGVPSTTVTSLTSFGTGLAPGGHGMAGYTCLQPENGEVLTPLAWNSDTSPRDFQPCPTELERLARAGVLVTSIQPRRFHNSGLTVAGLRGGEFTGIDDDDSATRIDKVVSAATSAEKTLVYAYEGELDHCGHIHGARSDEWLDCLMKIDRWASWLRAELPDDVRLIITGDHGMVNIARENRLVVEECPALNQGVRRIAGEARLRQLHLDDAVAPGEMARRCQEMLGTRAWVRTREEAIADGWFGPVDQRVIGRFGEVLLAMADDWAVLTREVPGEFDLIGMHGSLTAGEMAIPLLQP